MKAKEIGRLQVFLFLFSLVMLFVAYLSWSVRRSETPVRLYQVIDGDTVVFTGGKTIKLLGIDATFSGRVNTQLIRQYLSVLLTNKNIWLEYDRYLKDAAGFDLVWVWVGCEGAPKFWAVRGAEDNPVNCKNGALVNEQIIKMGWSRVNLPDKSIGVRYEKRLYAL